MNRKEIKTLLKEFCLDYNAGHNSHRVGHPESLQGHDWTSLTIGFCIALGMSVVEAKDLTEEAKHELLWWVEQ